MKQVPQMVKKTLVPETLFFFGLISFSEISTANTELEEL